MSEPHLIKRRTTESVEDDAWLITFADMSVLLMCFFILMFALSSIDPAQMKNVAKSLRESGFYNDMIPEVDTTQEVKKQLSLAISQQGYDTFVAASENKHGVDVELASSAFFEPGSAKFTAKAIPIMQMIAQKIAPLTNHDVIIEVEGHTDDTPIASEQFPSNWELSSARAANVVRYLIAQNFPAAKLRAVGVADTHPKVPNHDSTGDPIPANQNLNRRVVIKLIRGEDN